MTDTQTATPPSISTWTIDPAHSSVEFAVKHMMFATVKGRFSDVKGTITLDEQDLANSSVEIEIAVASIDTRDEGRDAHLRGPDFFDADTYPTATFRSTRVEPAGGENLRITGVLQIRDVSKEVVLDATFNGRGTSPFGPQVISYSATTTINRKDFGLNWNAALETGGVLVGEEVRISIEIEATS
jgi:polyisoprenoid-binding protein YceI